MCYLLLLNYIYCKTQCQQSAVENQTVTITEMLNNVLVVICCYPEPLSLQNMILHVLQQLIWTADGGQDCMVHFQPEEGSHIMSQTLSESTDTAATHSDTVVDK